MVQYEGIQIVTSKDGTVSFQPTLNFCFTKVRRNGLIKTTYEYTLTYNKHTHIWTGTVIDADGLSTLVSSKLNELIKEKRLDHIEERI